MATVVLMSQQESESGHIMQANGPFEVKLAPQQPAPGIEQASLGRMTIDKQFHGDLEATSLGEMLSAMGQVQGSAGSWPLSA